MAIEFMARETLNAAITYSGIFYLYIIPQVFLAVFQKRPQYKT